MSRILNRLRLWGEGAGDSPPWEVFHNMKNNLLAIVAAAAAVSGSCWAQQPTLKQPDPQSKTGKGRNTMKFILMMNMKTDPESMSKGIMTWAENDIKAHIQFMKDLNKQLKNDGELVGAEGLAWPNEAKLIRAGTNGEPVTDGVFPESKEFLIGYWIIDVDTPARAYAIAARASAAPGKGGVPLNMPIEVRQIMAGPPE
jgi:hypothetical protein